MKMTFKMIEINKNVTPENDEKDLKKAMKMKFVISSLKKML